MKPIQHSIIGLPGTGKTTFIAALWHLLTSNEISSKFVLNDLIGDRTHLESIADTWRRCEEVPRTSMAAETKVSMYVKDTRTNEVAILHFPDFSGESFEQQLLSRSCTSEYLEGFSGSGGIMLFVNANDSFDGLSIVDTYPLESSSKFEGEPDLHTEWEPNMVPRQVNLVELLQFLMHPPFERCLRRLVIIISAWDVIDTSNLEPIKWLEKELPLLFQFVSTNKDSFVFRVYGVSAQGGDVNSDARKELAMKTPSTRINCIGPETNPHDLTSPIAWLMSSE